MQRGCMKNAALVLAQNTFSFQRKLNFNFTKKNFFCQNCVCKMVDPKFETGFWPLYWVSSGGWWLYGLVYPHRFSGSQEKNLNWLLVLNMLGFINKSKILTFFPSNGCDPDFTLLNCEVGDSILGAKSSSTYHTITFCPLLQTILFKCMMHFLGIGN